VTIHYQNTRDEYLEASEALTTRWARKSVATRLLFAGSFAIYAMICTIVMTTTGAANSLSLTFHLWFPMAFYVIVIFVATLVKLFRSKIPGTRRRAGISLLLFLGLMVTSLYEMVVLSHQGNPSSAATWKWGWLVPHASWLFLTTTVLVATIVNQRALRKNMWAGQATLHRAKAAEISAEGLCITDAVSRLEYRWQAFAGWQETKSLFVIFMSQYQVIFLPKHAFGSAELLDAMRALAGLIPTTTSSAFQVVQPNSPPPLPADHHA
jgi:hypothetical protein